MELCSLSNMIDGVISNIEKGLEGELHKCLLDSKLLTVRFDYIIEILLRQDIMYKTHVKDAALNYIEILIDDKKVLDAEADNLYKRIISESCNLAKYLEEVKKSAKGSVLMICDIKSLHQIAALCASEVESVFEGQDKKALEIALKNCQDKIDSENKISSSKNVKQLDVGAVTQKDIKQRV